MHGSHEATDSIAEFCRKQQITDEIYSPAVGECVDVSSATNLFQIVLTDSLVSSMNMSKVRYLIQLENYKLGYVSGVIRKEEGLEGDRLVLDLQPFEEQKSKIPVTVGDVKLSELKKQLGAQGYNAQFVSGGVLVVNESIVIQKTEQGRLTVQGQVDSDYYKVRKILYTFQAIL